MIEKRLELNFWEKLWHHAPTSIFIFGGGCFTYVYLNQPDNLPAPAAPRTGLIITAIVFYAIALLIYLYLEKRLKFVHFPISIDKTEFIDRLLRKAEVEKWILTSEHCANPKRLEFRKLYFGSSYSDITVDIEDKIIFVNVRGRYPIDKKILTEIKSILD